MVLIVLINPTMGWWRVDVDVLLKRPSFSFRFSLRFSFSSFPSSFIPHVHFLRLRLPSFDVVFLFISVFLMIIFYSSFLCFFLLLLLCLLLLLPYSFFFFLLLPCSSLLLLFLPCSSVFFVLPNTLDTCYKYAAQRLRLSWHLSKEIGKQPSALLIKCNAVRIHHITIQRITIHHVTVHRVTVHHVSIQHITWQYIT